MPLILVDVILGAFMIGFLVFLVIASAPHKRF